MNIAYATARQLYFWLQIPTPKDNGKHPHENLEGICFLF